MVAEMVAYTRTAAGVRELLRRLDIVFEPTTFDSAVLAGRIFRGYRDRGGPRQHLIPDFLIAAHAATQADQLAAVDRGFLRTYFPKLRVVAP